MLILIIQINMDPSNEASFFQDLNAGGDLSGAEITSLSELAHAHMTGVFLEAPGESVEP